MEMRVVKMIVEYITITHTDQHKFVETVNSNISRGFVPFGGISIAIAGNEIVQMQAMVKYA